MITIKQDDVMSLGKLFYSSSILMEAHMVIETQFENIADMRSFLVEYTLPVPTNQTRIVVLKIPKPGIYI